MLIQAVAVEALHFDLDGVLIDSEPLNIFAEQEVCRRHGLAVPDSEWSGQFQGMPNRAIFEHLIRKFAKQPISTDVLIAAKRKLYLELAPQKIKMVPGALDVLKKVREHFSRVALVTGSSKIVQERIFEIFGLAPYFDAVVTADEVKNGKPHPDSYLLACSRLEVLAAKSIVVEDSLNGIKAALAAHCRVIGLATSWPGADLLQAGAHYLARNFTDVGRILAL